MILTSQQINLLIRSCKVCKANICKIYWGHVVFCISGIFFSLHVIFGIIKIA